METFILSHHSYLLLPLLTATGIPVPEEVVTVAAGALSSPSIGRLEPGLAIFACLAGVLVGDCALYWIGRSLGQTHLGRYRWFARLVDSDRTAHVVRILQQHGVKVFLLVRFVFGMRTPLYLAIGALKMDFRRFLVCDLVGGTLAVGTFFLLSYLGAGWISGLIHRSEWAATAMLLVTAVTAGLYYGVWKRWRVQLSPHRPGLQGKAQ
ncbi:MAG: DedA family protein [Mycobacterium pseudokansasii]|uniref:Putative membrane protein n=1 Tax=Mycobacterium pseudokansasii TaxID=2341080 RepID=A0A498QMP2_9MYCO|nr:DedA family protein [Mycobacterium pseudokansasii]KZS65271.1 hypothetical protein A4G27_20770 [Mycobacterium kansasii]MBY0390513.1 DedA family protein [Mycobacterium pseudokansasii]VAZ91438.1 putative membrane protein [Mycobacterium pseudokansasii]VAZ92372.1 putative membrane protein [Mycobacterium pseudokansasii]VBA48627.1 putative membrane protein [Mycobacterium pseudokansasii]